eukprot:CAMPEP_0170442566 /NCGR_PEP_ID=MMETSP0117_2-20130122/47492_1 /TAXON_ID=400756 /ORGANISM="Durinskia baltica, Strain CSIRO CS-38" /LENGTH=429 /DNA_ID=CAMNT_0010703175 /DNA_START=268 /DNA_END=1557 /DNA_ORIENTATION=+
MNQANQSRLDMLENELSTAKSAMIKEGIRSGHTYIGQLMYQMGNLGEALKAFLRSRDFCTMPRHTIDMCLNVISVSIDMNQFFNASNFIGKVVDDLGDDVVIGKLQAASALVDLNDRKFQSAAMKFLNVNPMLGNQFNTTISEEDIAMYGSILAIATFERADLRSRLIENKPFINTYLNLAPDFKALAMAFYSGDYPSAIQKLKEVQPRLLCDIHLNSHVKSLMLKIDERMLLQYFSPYCSLDLSRMATHLQMTPTALEDSLVELISSGKLAARIDLRTNTLHRRERNLRSDTVAKVLAVSNVHSNAICRDILHLSMAKQGFALGDMGELGGLSNMDTDMSVGGMNVRADGITRQHSEGSAGSTASGTGTGRGAHNSWVPQHSNSYEDEMGMSDSDIYQDGGIEGNNYSDFRGDEETARRMQMEESPDI